MDKVKKEKTEFKMEPQMMSVEITFTHPLLGTAPGDEDVYATFIGKKSADAEKIEQELASLPQEELVEKGKTVFHRDSAGNPILYDYQIKGFLKEYLKIATEFGVIKIKGKDISNYTCGRIGDNFLYVYPREIPIILPRGGEITQCVRPLRAKTLQGDRIALSCSEQIPAGSKMQIQIEWFHPGLEKYVIDALNYGEKKGIGQWRNSGMGRFVWSKVA